MRTVGLWPAAVLFSIGLVAQCQSQDLILNLNISQNSPNSHVVFSNFMGISIELSTINTYFGNSVDTVPQPVINYLNAIRPTDGRPLRVRIGGNSMDSSTFVPNQSVMIEPTGINSSSNDISCTFGPTLFDVLNAVGKKIGGAQYLIGLSLRDPQSPNITTLAAYAEKSLTSSLDALLLGNEPDLYTAHDNRPYLTNYTTADYFSDYQTVDAALGNSSSGNLLQTTILGGPTICCNWDLNALIGDGYLREFSDELKYITLQHYPQNNCGNVHSFGIDYYLQHVNVVSLASWQSAGVASSVSASKPVIMTEFNTASCGGIPDVSDRFGAALWTTDYSLQLAAQGFAAAYLHTREGNVTYSLFFTENDQGVPTQGFTTSVNPNGNWTTNPSYYALLPITAALSPGGEKNTNSSGSMVVDLNVNGSMSANSTSAGYAIYDANSTTTTPSKLVLFNYGPSSSTLNFTLDSGAFGTVQGSKQPPKSVRVAYLRAHSVEEATAISWGGFTLAGVTNGVLKPISDSGDTSWATPNVSIPCDDGCGIQVPGPGLAVVWLERNSVSGGSTWTHDPSRLQHNLVLGISVTVAFSILGFLV